MCHYANELAFEVRDKDHAFSEFIGAVSFPTAEIMLPGAAREGAFPIVSKHGKHHGELNLRVQVHYSPIPEKGEKMLNFPSNI